MKKQHHLIQGSNIGVKSGQRWLIRDVDIAVARGEIVTLIGPNGSGKSTLAKVVLGVLKPSTGKIVRQENLSIGYVPQKLNIDWTFPLSVSRLLSITRAHNKSEIELALEAVNIAHLKDVPVQQLSGGEFQRALLARAMILKPDLLVLDEPVQGVDYPGQAALYDLIGNLRTQTGCGVLMISHDLHIVMAQTDRVVCLNGHVCCSGAPELVASSPQFMDLFGEQAQKTHAIYQHHHDHTHLASGQIKPGNQPPKEQDNHAG